jgi:hypothetical protein
VVPQYPYTGQSVASGVSTTLLVVSSLSAPVPVTQATYSPLPALSTSIVSISEAKPSGAQSGGSSQGSQNPPTTTGPESSGALSATSTGSPAGNTTSPTSKPPSSNGLSGGPVAGVAIGCLIAGAIIASLILFFFVIRKNRRRGQHAYAGNNAYAPPPHAEKGAVATGMISIPQDSSAAVIEHYLPPPTEDEQLKNEVSRLKDKINGHVQSYYHSRSGTNDQAAASALVEVLGAQSQLPAERIPKLLADPATRASVLRYAVAWIIISRIGLECDANTCFLPWQLVSCVHEMPKTKMDDKREFQALTPNGFANSKLTMMITARMAFLSKWRQITSALFPPSYNQANSMDASDPRGENVRKAVQVADEILCHYANTNDPERLRNLEEITKRAVRLAFMLFSHPTFWKFDWTGAAPSELVIFPALLQLTNEAGTLLPRPVKFTSAEVGGI